MKPNYYNRLKRVEKARNLRKNQTKAEMALWNQLRNRKLEGLKFRRQHFMDEIIVDFYCIEKRLCIEVDGPYHDDPVQKELDRLRDEELQSHGKVVLRFTNDRILCNMIGVLDEIAAVAANIPTFSRPPLNHREKFKDISGTQQ